MFLAVGPYIVPLQILVNVKVKDIGQYDAKIPKLFSNGRNAAYGSI